MSNQASVLVIDDEIQIRRLLQITLEAADYKVYLSSSAEEGLQQTAMVRPEIVILDLGLPDMDGIIVLKKLREWSTIPIIILSVRSTEKDIINALDAGADDYLTKPFRSGELLARLRTALRHRLTSEQGTVFEWGSLYIDLTNRIVRKNGEPIKLTPTEYSLLTLFVRHAGKVLTHRYILKEIWGPTFEEESQYSRIYVAQLRKKLEDDPTSPKLLLTESGIGYRLVIP
jgi:two-component system, OmpR family, KDP operon response regulator KdpE